MMSTESCWETIRENTLGRLVITDGQFVDVLPAFYGVTGDEI